MRFITRLAAALCFLACAAAGCCLDGGYSSRALPSAKASAAPTIDGDVSDPVWASAPKAETFIDPQTGKPVADQTTAMILYDDKNIYVAFIAKDSQPDKITARETIQDYRFGSFYFDSGSEDALEVGFDPFNTHKQPDRSIFAVNALGTRSSVLGGGRG